MKCVKCGRETPSNIPNCVHCGYSFRRSAQGSVQKPAAPAARKNVAGSGTHHASSGRGNNHPYAKPKAGANPYAKPVNNAGNPYAKPPLKPQNPYERTTAMPARAHMQPNVAAQSGSGNKTGIIIGACAGGFVLLLILIFGIWFLFGSGSDSSHGNNAVVYADTDSSSQQEIDVLNDVYDGFKKTQEPYLNGEYVKPDSVDEALESAYEYANSLVKDGTATGAKIEKENLCVMCDLKQGDRVIYVPQLENMKAGSGLNRVLTLQPYYNTNIRSDSPDSAANYVADNNKNYQFANADNLNDEAVNIDSIAKFKGAKLIIWDGHGDYNSEDHSLINIEDSYNKLRQSKKYGKYCKDGSILASSYGTCYLTAAFFENYLKESDLANAVVYLGTCLSGKDSVLADALKNKGAKAVFGNTYITTNGYDGDMMESIFQSMAKGTSADSALKTAKKKHGAKGDLVKIEGEKGRTVVKLFGNGGTKLAGKQAESQTQTTQGNFTSIEKYIKTYASGYAGGWMSMRGDGKNVYFCDKYYTPQGVYQFNAASGKTRKLVSIAAPKYGKANVVEFYEAGFGVKLYNTSEIKYDTIAVYDHSGNRVAKNANTYVREYDGERVYSCSDTMVESWRADGGKIYNSDIDFDIDNSPFKGGRVMNVYSCKGKEFIELFYEGRNILITAVGNTYKEIAEVESTCYLDGANLYYIKSGNILKIDLSRGDYKATTFCKADADYIYYITGKHICYGKNSQNGGHFTAYSMDVGSKAVKIADGDCPLDGV